MFKDIHSVAGKEHPPDDTAQAKRFKAPWAIVLVPVGIVLAGGALVVSQRLGPGAPIDNMPTELYSFCQDTGLDHLIEGGNLLEPTLQATPSIASVQFQGHLPDLEFLPIYPGATEYDQGLIPGKVGDRRFIYSVPAGITDVLQFYSEAFKRYDWRPLEKPLPLTGTVEQTYNADYNWDDPSATSPWHMRLNIDIRSTNDITGITLNYGRYPDMGKNLPTSPDATAVHVTCFESSPLRLKSDDTTYTAKVTKVFITNAKPDQILEYYSAKLPEYGWKPGETKSNYSGGGYRPILGITLGADLKIATAAAEDGRTRVELTSTIKRLMVYMTDQKIP